MNGPAQISAAAPAGAVEVLTFGCRLNIVESEAMRQAALAAGHRGAIIVNTCAVTSEAARQARQAIRRAARERPDAKIIVTGCASETARESFASLPNVAAVLPNARKTRPDIWAALPGAGDTIVASATLSARTRGFVAIQNGCDHRCTFCIIPFGRGASRSTPMGEILASIRALVETGHRDVILTGVDLTSWGADLPGEPKLGSLVKAVLREIPELPRLRLSSLDCIEADPDLFDAFGREDRLMPHLHLSLQSGDDLVLKRMKRRHSRADAIAFCADMRRIRPDIVFGADFIAGFPTETDSMFENTIALAQACGLTHLHVFPYSPRPETAAARMPQVSGSAIQERAERLRSLGSELLTTHLDRQIGQTLEVLTERGGTGRARDFTQVQLGSICEPGVFASVTIAGRDTRRLIAA